MPFRFPDDTQRLAIVGVTGSGKTQAAVWHLSARDFEQKPWIVYNFKRDEIVDGIPHVRHIGLEEIPAAPGVYVVHPGPQDGEAVENQMWHLWDAENVGVYIDEGFMVKRNNEAFEALLTQGRSKHIPMIVLSQRPRWISRFVFTEAEFVQIFELQWKNDRKTVEEFVPADLESELPKLPRYYSLYWDRPNRQLTPMARVPSLDTIYATFARRLRGKKVTV